MIKLEDVMMLNIPKRVVHYFLNVFEVIRFIDKKLNSRINYFLKITQNSGRFSQIKNIRSKINKTDKK